LELNLTLTLKLIPPTPSANSNQDSSKSTFILLRRNGNMFVVDKLPSQTYNNDEDKNSEYPQQEWEEEW
jgi:hypothetical protein